MKTSTQRMVCIVLFLFAFGIRAYDLENMPTQDDEQLWLARSYAFIHTVFNAEPDITPLTRIYSDNGSVDVFETGDNLLPDVYPFTIRTEAHHPGVPASLLIGLSYVFLAEESHPASLDLVSTIVAIKLPNVVVGSLLVVVVFMGATYLFGWRIGLASAVLIAVSPMMIGYSRLGRIDMLSAFFSVCMMFSYIVRVQQSARRKHLQWTMLTGVFAGLGMATNPYAVYCVPVFAVVKILLTPRSKENRYRRFLPDVYDVLFFVIWIVVYLIGHPNMLANPIAGFAQWINVTFTHQIDHIVGTPNYELYPLLTIVTMLPTTMILILLGTVGRWSAYKRQVVILVVWVAWFLLLLSIPTGKKNLKNLLQLMIPLAILAGLGVDWLAVTLAGWWRRFRERTVYIGLVALQIVIGLGVTAYWYPLPHLFVLPGVYVPLDDPGNFATSNGIKPALDYAYAHSPYPAERFMAVGARNNLLFHLSEDELDYPVEGRFEIADWLIVPPKVYERGGDKWYFDVEPTHILVHRQVEIAALYYLPDFFPREQYDTSAPMIRYDNGIEIYDIATDVTDETLTLTTLWGEQPEDPYGFSIQVFDAEMNKVAQGDYLLPVEVKQTSALDVSDVPAGEYRVLLITYDLATGTSLDGIDLTADTAFQRSYDVGVVQLGDVPSD